MVEVLKGQSGNLVKLFCEMGFSEGLGSRLKGNQWLHVVERVITAIASLIASRNPSVSLLLQRNGGYEQVVSCEWDPGGAGRIERVGTDGGSEPLNLLRKSEHLVEGRLQAI